MRRSGPVITVLAFVLLIALTVSIISGVSARSGASETELVLHSVRSAALACYAAEGAYPGSLDYLKEHYGLYYDETIYTVAYDAFASNIFPDIYVMEGGAGER